MVESDTPTHALFCVNICMYMSNKIGLDFVLGGNNALENLNET